MTLVSYREAIARNILQPLESETVQKAGSGFLPWKRVSVSGEAKIGAVLIDMSDTLKNTGTTTSATAATNTDILDLFASEVQIGDIAGEHEQPVLRSASLTRKGAELLEQQVFDSSLRSYPQATAATIGTSTSKTFNTQLLVPIGGVASAAIRINKPEYSTVFPKSTVTELSPGATYNYYGIPVDVMDRFRFVEQLSDSLPKGNPSIITQQPADMTAEKAILFQAPGTSNPITAVRATSRSRMVAFADSIAPIQAGQKFAQRATLFPDQVNLTPGGERLTTFQVTLSTASTIKSLWFGITEESPGSLPPEKKAAPPAPAPKIGPVAGGAKSFFGRKMA